MTDSNLPTQSELSTLQATVPNYLVGADNHNIGNTLGGSWFDPSTWEEKFQNTGKFVTASLLSGADSLYNSAATVGNFLGADIEIKDTGAWITSLDQDLGQYYAENRQSADLAGFIASSFVPGLGGIKILNAGQNALKAAKATGLVGKNLAQYTSILAPSTEAYVKLAGHEIVAAQTVFNTINVNTVKALGAGLWQNTLEAAAFETFVQATMFKSPILEHEDKWDIAKNIMTGAALGGVIGGSFEAARTFGSINKVRSIEDLRIKNWSSRERVQEGTLPSDKIILASENKSLTPLPDAPPPGANATQEEFALYNAQLTNARVAREKKLRGINLDQQVLMHEMNKGANDEVINLLATTQRDMGLDMALKNWHGALEITAPLSTTHLEREALKDPINNIRSRYVTLVGENAGQVTDALPATIRVADRMSAKTGGKDSLVAAVKSEVRDAGFKTSELWNPLDKMGKLSWRQAELRHIWADTVAKIPEDISIHANDIPLLERLIVKDGRLDFRVVLDSKKVAETISFTSVKEAETFLIRQKEALANDMLAKRIGKVSVDDAVYFETTTEAIAKTVNVRQSYLEGTRAANASDDLYAWQRLSQDIHELRVSKGVKNANDPVEPSYFVPTLAKVNYQIPENAEIGGYVIDALAFVKARQKIIREDADRVTAKQAGSDINDRLVPISSDKLMTADSKGAGPGMVSSASGGYGSLNTIVQYIGGVAKDLQAKIRRGVDERVQAPLYQLANNQKAAIEFDAINQQLSRTSEHYIIDHEGIYGFGAGTLVPARYKKALVTEEGMDHMGNKLGSSKVVDPDMLRNEMAALQENAPTHIQIENYDTQQAILSHQSLTATRTANAKERWAVQGKQHDYDPEVVRPIRPNPKDYSHFAFVTDPRVTGSGHSTMLFANTERELQDLIVKTQRDFPEFSVFTKRETAEWHAAQQSYEYSKGLNENYIDSSLKAKGIYSNFYTRSDSQTIANDILQFHYRSADLESSEILRLKYGDAFNWLENQAEAYANFESSKFISARYDKIIQNEKNPYVSYIKTALNLSSTPTSNPWWSLNKFLDNQVSRAVGRIRQTWDAAKTPEDLAAVNSLMEHYGSQTAFNSAAEVALVNHTAPKAELSKFVRSANAIMSRFTLGLDPLNSINNAVGANILRGTELTQFVRAIKNGNAELAGELSALAKVKIPGVEDEILSPTKLMAQSISRMFGPNGKALIQEYKSAGLIRDRLEQFHSMADDMTLRGTESVKELNDRIAGAFSKAKKLADAGETLTGNKFAEEFNRFISADVMRQLTDLGEKHGLLTRQESLVYINNFVNRVEGNVIATQRPGLFQGPLGQAVGLFQSYQFNLLQNLFRYVAEGGKKDLGMLLGLQGTFYGLQGEPGFKFVNDHIIGTASGNQQHRDMYDAVRGIAGHTAGNWLLYGTASNIMQTNIYSRGDINPRQVTLIPTNIADVPFVGGMGKIFATLNETTKKIANGGAVWESIRQGIEHNGVSRPLAGLAQVARAVDNDGTVFSTSSKGTILGSNDLMSLATLSRLAGGRPLDEAVLNDTMFSINSYEAYDRSKKNALAETVKSTMVKNKNPDENDVTEFAKQYAYLGGKQGSFSKYMMEQYTKANTPAAQLLSSKLAHPLSYKVQGLMGGDTQ